MNIDKITPMQAWCIIEADQAIEWARITSHMEIQRMKRHSLNYIDLHPEPVEQEPAEWVIWLMAAVALVSACALLVILLGWPV